MTPKMRPMPTSSLAVAGADRVVEERPREEAEAVDARVDIQLAGRRSRLNVSIVARVGSSSSSQRLRMTSGLTTCLTAPLVREV